MNALLPSTAFAFSCLEKKIFLEYLVASGNMDCASHCNPMAFDLRIPSFIVAFSRARRWVVHYASKQFRQLLYKQLRNREGWGLQPPLAKSLKNLN